jgi:hypothetical protein
MLARLELESLSSWILAAGAQNKQVVELGQIDLVVLQVHCTTTWSAILWLVLPELAVTVAV